MEKQKYNTEHHVNDFDSVAEYKRDWNRRNRHKIKMVNDAYRKEAKTKRPTKYTYFDYYE